MAPVNDGNPFIYPEASLLIESFAQAIPKTVDDISGVIAKQYQDIEALQGALELSLRASDDLEIRLCDAQRLSGQCNVHS